VSSRKDLLGIAEERGLRSGLMVDELLSKHTSYRIGGPADFFTSVKYEDQLRAWVALARELELPCLVFGRGTNLLVADAGFRGLIIENRCSACNVDDDTHTAHTEAGVPLARLARETVDKGWQGLEWAIGIPGTVGGAIVNNAGAYESSMADCVREVTILDEQGETQRLTPEELRLGYRTSRFRESTGRGEIILSSDLTFTPGSPSELEERVQRYRRLRRDAQPREPSAGSVFKNPQGLKAAKLIDDAGLKGTSIGDAEISHKHANYIVNKGQATADQVWQLIQLVMEKVWELFEVRMELEIELIGEWSDAVVS
jgi:UDP-N-acetylmuramate dehydrogenase